MCGIVGYWDKRGADASIVEQMANQIIHRGPLREWGEELLDEKRLREKGFFDPVPIWKMWHEHVSGKRRWHYYLWDVLMFQAWLGIQKSEVL
jgi:asparagine synthetase B (glutamine-hydrolysing)